MPLHINSPLIKSLALSERTGSEVYLKMDSAQPPGSFKIRGIGHACETYAKQGAKRFVASSGGNAGMAVAYAGRQLDIPVVVVVPETASQHAQKLLALDGAQVIVHGASWQEANALAQSMLAASDAFIHPFDDALLWEGHATMIDEVAQTGFKPAAVIVSVGGGGLLSGVVQGLRRNSWANVPVLAVETEGAASLNLATKTGELVALHAITSIATSLGAKQVCAQAFEDSQSHPVKSVVTSDANAVRACMAFLDDHRVLVEPACGAALSVAYDALPLLAEYRSILIVVCGGATMTAEQLRGYSLGA
jgi:L-serine/L-threonine ammonia-lyase